MVESEIRRVYYITKEYGFLLLDGLFKGCDSLNSRNVDREDAMVRVNSHAAVKGHVCDADDRGLSRA